MGTRAAGADLLDLGRLESRRADDRPGPAGGGEPQVLEEGSGR
jgi:hypothetical protein